MLIRQYMLTPQQFDRLTEIYEALEDEKSESARKELIKQLGYLIDDIGEETPHVRTKL